MQKHKLGDTNKNYDASRSYQEIVNKSIRIEWFIANLLKSFG